MDHHVSAKLFVVLVELGCHQLDGSHLLHRVDPFCFQYLEISHLGPCCWAEAQFVGCASRASIKFRYLLMMGPHYVMSERELRSFRCRSCSSSLPVVGVLFSGDFGGSGPESRVNHVVLHFSEEVHGVGFYVGVFL